MSEALPSTLTPRGGPATIDGMCPEGANIRKVIDLHWQGPFAWPDTPGGPGIVPLEQEHVVASSAGVYLWTVEHGDKYLIYAAGQTRRSFLTRLREHSKAHRHGFFTVFDMEAMKQGRRDEIWHGFFTRRRPPAREMDFTSRQEEIQRAVAKQLAEFRIFVAPLAPEPRLLQRIESGIMRCLYDAPPPFSTIPDQGMSLSGRWRNEEAISVRNIEADKFHALPAEIEV